MSDGFPKPYHPMFQQEWKDYKIPKQKMPCCGYEIDVMTLTEGPPGNSIEEMLAQPDHQAVCICAQCAQWLTVGPDFTHRLVTAEEIAEMPADFRAQLRVASEGVLRVRKLMAK